MASTYTTDLRFNLQGIGDNNNTWGTVLNTQLSLIDNAISGTTTVNVTTGVDVTLSTANGTADEARNMILKLSGTPIANINVIVPAVSKMYIIDATSLAGSFSVTIKPTAGTGVAFTAGQTGVVTCDGTNVIEIYRTITPFQTGMIIMWSGTISTIPTGWLLCDGTNSTPDLRDKFIVGARQDSGGAAKTNITGTLTQSGGSTTTDAGGSVSAGVTGDTTLTTAQIPSHSHASSDGGGFLTLGSPTPYPYGGGTRNFNLTTSTASTGGGGSHNHTTPAIPTHTHGTVQPYYALAFIMKS